MQARFDIPTLNSWNTPMMASRWDSSSAQIFVLATTPWRLALTDQVPFPVTYQHLLKYYIIARAELRDDEYSQDGRAAALLGIFEKELKA